MTQKKEPNVWKRGVGAVISKGLSIQVSPRKNAHGELNKEFDMCEHVCIFALDALDP